MVDCVGYCATNELLCEATFVNGTSKKVLVYK